MNHLRRLCAVMMLACVLTGAAFAGDIHCGVTDPPPPPPPETAQACGDISCGVTETVATLLESALSLL